MTSDPSTMEEAITQKIKQIKFDDIHELNSSKMMGDNPVDAQKIVSRLLKQHKENYRRDRRELSVTITADKARQMGAATEQLDKRLQEHIKMLRQNEGSLGSNNVLEFESAKNRADKLAEILRAKMVWTTTYEEIQLLSPLDHALKYQKLVALQQSHDVLHKYSKNTEREMNFEKLKDEFLSWFSSATILAIDANDFKQLESLREKFSTLNRLSVFEQSFGSYAKNKIKCFIDDESGREITLLGILQEIFSIWKRCRNLADSFTPESTSGSSLIAKSLFEGVIGKWEDVLKIILSLTCASETPLIAARGIGKIRKEFLSFVESEGDEHILQVSTRICQKIFSVMSEGYGKHVTSLLLCTINKITLPEKASRYRYDWLHPYIDEIQQCMREMIVEAKGTFGEEFSQNIVPSFEHGVKELCSLLRNQDLLNIKRVRESSTGVSDGKRSESPAKESTDNKIAAMCCSGYLLEMVDEINSQIREVSLEFGSTNDPQLISNISLIESLNKKVVEKKIKSIANTILKPMEEEMLNLKMESTSLLHENSDETFRLSLPAFSTPPHNYITSVGHGLLNQMNAIGSYASDRKFIRAVTSVAGKNVQEEEVDLWVLSEVAKHIMDGFCHNVGNLGTKLIRQFHVDIVFLMEALVDLRIQPTTRLTDFEARLKKAMAS